VGAALALVDPSYAPRAQLALLAATAVACLAVSALAWARYRVARDPHLLWVAIGMGVLGVQLLGYGIVWPLRRPALPAGAILEVDHDDGISPLPVLAWQGAWLVAGMCLSLAVPWRDRRGRVPIRPAQVLAIAVVGLAVVQAFALLAIGTLREEPAWQLWGGPILTGHRFSLGPYGWVVGGLTVAALAVTSVREARHPGQAASSLHPWVAAACLIAVPAQVGTIVHPLQGLGGVQWGDVAQPLVPIVLFAGLLVSHRGELSRMRRATDRADEVLGGRAEIASMVAHEVRGPVSTIKGLAATTTSSYDKLSDAERKEFVGLIHAEAGRLLDVVDQTSLALKLDAGTLTFTRRRQALAPIVREAADAARTEAHPVTVELDEIEATVDRQWLAEAIRQVVDNAARYSPDDAPIEVQLRRKEGDVVIEVGDRGPGIPAERRDEVFRRFTTWRPPGYEDRSGSGLGLFICRALLAEHRGEVAVADLPGGGTMLQLRLPAEGWEGT